MKNIYRILVVIVVILATVLIGAGCRTNDEPPHEPDDTSECIIPIPGTVPTANSTLNPSFSHEPTETKTETPCENIPLSETSGTREDVFARLEQFKHLPKEATLILLDVGHGGFDGGAVGSFIGTLEADLNLAVARYLSDELAKMGYYVFMTRMGDYGVTTSKDTDMEKRTEIMHLDIFDLSVSIHMDSFKDDPSVHGARVYCMEGRNEAKRLASCVLQQIITAFDPPHKQLYVQSFDKSAMVVREPVSPGILVECGFISNQEEEAKLNTPEYQQQMAAAIAKGIRAFIEGQPIQ